MTMKSKNYKKTKQNNNHKGAGLIPDPGAYSSRQLRDAAAIPASNATEAVKENEIEK